MQSLLSRLAELNVKIEVREGQLHVNAPSGVLTTQLRSAIREHKEDLIARLSEARPAQEELFATLVADRANLHEPFPLNEVQHAYWVGRSSEIELGGVATHMYFECDCEALDAQRLTTALRKVIAHHDMLRAIVDTDGRQRILESPPQYTIAEVDLRDFESPRREARLLEARAQMAQQVLPCDRSPLIEIRLAQLPDRKSRLFVSCDLLMLDAWSMFLIFRQWRELYFKPDYALEPVSISFRDYVLAAARLREASVYQGAKKYWWDRIDSLPGAPMLPVVSRLDSGRKHPFTRRRHRLTAPQWSAIKTYARSSGITPSSVLLAAFTEVLSRWSKSTQYCLNLTLFNRLPLHEQVGALVGDFTNLLLLEIDGSGTSFLERASRIQRQFLQDFEHRRVSAVDVIRELVKRRGWQRRVAFPVVFTSTLMLDGKRVEDSSVLEAFGPMTYGISQTPQVWLDYQIFESGGELVFNWDAVEEIFLPGVLDAMFGAHRELLELLASSTAAWDRDEVVFLPQHQQLARAAANATDAQQIEGCLHTLFVENALRRPEKVAVECAGRELTYGELLARSQQLALELIARGAQPNQLVAVVMAKGWEQVVAVLAIHIAGGAYLPIDVSWPAKRREQLLAQGEVKVLLTQEALESELQWPADMQRVSVSANEARPWLTSAPPVRQSPKDLAYVIFTSGSTGTPKGVMIDHRMAVNTVVHMNRLFGVTEHDAVLAVSELSFDLSVYDIFGLLAAGGRVVMPQGVTARDPGHWCALIRSKTVTLWNSAPQLMGLLADAAESDAAQDISPLRRVFLSGDWIPVRLPDRIKALAREAEVISLGGATEGSVWSIFYPVAGVDPSWDSVPYGKALPNQHMYVLNKRLQSCPDHVVGDIYIGGQGVALGYWRDAEKTARQFIHHPATSERLYLTGDLGRYRADANIEFLGREDSQVKLRGYRVELGEITATLQSHPNVREAVVRLLKQDGRGALSAYLVADRSESSELFAWTAPPENELRQQFHHAVESGHKQSADADLPGLKAFAALWSAVHSISVRSMFETLSSLALLGDETVHERLEKLASEGRVLARYRRLIQRWIKTLTEEGLARIAVASSVDEQLRALQAMSENDDRLKDFFESFASFIRNQLTLLSGAVVPQELLFPEGSWRLAEAWYEKNPAVRHHSAVMAAMAHSFTRTAAADQRIRVLELGAGTGGISTAVLAQLPTASTEYWYTDVSSYFFAAAREKFRRYPFVQFGVYTIDQGPESQGHEPNSFDIVIAANVLHNARDIPTTLRHIRDALKPGGMLMLLEGTRNTVWQWVNASYLEGNESYSDERAQADAPALSAQQWAKVLQANQFGPVHAFPAQGADNGEIASLLEAMPQHVIVAQGPLAVSRFQPEALARYLADRIPHYMIPQRFVLLEKLPLSANGKVNLEALPVETSGLETASRRVVNPRSDSEGRILEVWKNVLGRTQLSITDNFFEVGGDSLLLTEVMRRVNKSESGSLTMADLFAHPTVQRLAEYLTEQSREQAHGAAVSSAPASPATRDIAIIGMAGRFPDARNIETLWENLAASKCAVRQFSDAELLEAGVSPEELSQAGYVKAGLVLEDMDLFDAPYFGVTPREAEIMDPQHRFLLECGVEALENAGYPNEKRGGRIGVFAGKGTIFYLLEHVLQRPDIVQTQGMLQIMNVNDKDHVAPMISYKLNLTGPSLNVNTACSTSLVAVHSACQSLLDEECEIALAGGVSFVSLLRKSGHVYQEGHITSPDGYCRAFADDAQGCVFGSGVGLVVLKPLAAAIRDRDTIHAVIKGSAINNDGSLKVGYSAPSLHGQAEVIAAAQRRAGVGPETIQYIEAHGTGTQLGDPIEFGALRRVFGGRRADGSRCALGSVKTNVGHLDSAAGVAGLIKVVESMKHRQIPASLFATAPSRKIDFDDSPFYVNSQLSEWQAGASPRRAGVSSFGVGGTNAHVIVEEAPRSANAGADRSDSQRSELILLSAQDASRLAVMRAELAAHLDTHPEICLQDAAFTLQVGRNAHKHRAYLVCDNVAAASRDLKTPLAMTIAAQHEERSSSVVFLFPGQGAQRSHVTRQLYRDDPAFRKAFDTCADLVQSFTGRDIRVDSPDIDQTALTQPLLFSIEYALAQLWQSVGVRPAAMLGHSLGEYVAACVAGVFSLEEALSLVIVRGQLLQSLPRGSMLAVNCSEAELQPLIVQAGCDLAAVNGPAQCVVSGSEERTAQIKGRLDALDIPWRVLRTSHAFHSSMLDSVLDTYEECVRQVQLNPPRIPYISGLSGQWITAEQTTSTAYWAQHMRRPVRFFEGIRSLQRLEGAVMLEVGPGHALCSLARSAGLSADRAVASLGHDPNALHERRAVLDALGRMWLHGVDIDWMGLHGQSAPRRIGLPAYSFARKRYWIERRTARAAPAEESLSAGIQSRLVFAEAAEPRATSYPRPHLKSAYVPASNEIESRIIELWQDCLGIEGIGTHDNFFELGGDSLLATRVYSSLKKEFDVELPMRRLFELATIRNLYMFIATSRQTDSLESVSEEELESFLALIES